MCLCHVSCIMFNLSLVTCHLSPVTFHLFTTLCSFNCYESPRRLGDAAQGCLVIDRMKKKIFFSFLQKKPTIFVGQFFYRKTSSLEVLITLQKKGTMWGQWKTTSNRRDFFFKYIFLRNFLHSAGSNSAVQAALSHCQFSLPLVPHLSMVAKTYPDSWVLWYFFGIFC